MAIHQQSTQKYRCCFVRFGPRWVGQVLKSTAAVLFGLVHAGWVRYSKVPLLFCSVGPHWVGARGCPRPVGALPRQVRPSRGSRGGGRGVLVRISGPFPPTVAHRLFLKCPNHGYNVTWDDPWRWECNGRPRLSCRRGPCAPSGAPSPRICASNENKVAR